MGMGWTLFNSGRFSESCVAFKKLVSLDPKNPLAWMSLGYAIEGNGCLPDAIEIYRKVIDLKPDYVKAYFKLGILFKEIGEPEKAIVNYRKAIELKPDFAKAYSKLGAVLEEVGKVEDAIANYRKAIELTPDFAGGYLMLGNVLKGEGSVEMAVDCFLTSIKIDNTTRGSYYQLFGLCKDAERVNEVSLMNNLSSAILRSISAEEVIAFGDSHVGIFGGIPGFEKVWVGPATAYNLIESKTSTRGRQKILDRLKSATPGRSAILLSFGEVDCRGNIIKCCEMWFAYRCCVHKCG